jgi:hypothetical protein
MQGVRHPEGNAMTLAAMSFDWLTLDNVQKGAQVAFFFTTGVLAVQTYRKAKNGLLNSVNTEYQKRVMDRLKELSDDLFAEFDSESESHWSKQSSAKDCINEINEVFERHKESVLASGKWYFGYLVTGDIQRLTKLLAPLESDPFVPKQIRDVVTTFLKDRLDVMRGIYFATFEKYASDLAKGRRSPATDLDSQNAIHNKLVEQLNQKGCGVTQIEQEVHEIRQAIQKHFESFIPK